VKAARVIMLFLLLAGFAPAGADSLWSPDFKGYLSGSKGLAVGDVLVVQIDASSSLSFSASSNDSKSLTLEFTGGDSGNLFSFLPQVRTGGTQTTTGRDNLSLKTQMPVLVTAVNPDGTAQVQGSRTIAVQGKNESITVSGSLSPGLLDQKGTVAFSRLANARLAYTTLLTSAQDVLTQADLQTLLAPAAATGAAATAGAPAAAAAPGTTAAPGAAATAPAAGAAATAAAPAAPQTTITDARKKQLLLLYLNRLIDIVFSQ
jgi:flagellar basal body L-ring protein FlgH